MPKSTKKKGANRPGKNASLTTGDLAAILHLIQPPMKLGLSNPALGLASLRARKPARTADKQETQLTHDELGDIAKLLRSPITLALERRTPSKRKGKSRIAEVGEEKRKHGRYHGPRLR
ncbi:MAG TPA: hypothetical protein VIH88_13720 [Candidatus Acidoferrales bacterium]